MLSKEKIMTTEKIEAKEILDQLDETTSAFLNVISSFTEEEINTIPFQKSWSAAQVADHVMQSTDSMVNSLNTKGKITLRSIDEGVQGLKDVFLNFDTKLQSPKFILPGKDLYNREELIEKLNNSFWQLKTLSNTVDLSETINHVVFGDITKLEIVHFVVYHTQRHIHQLKNIFQTVANR